MTLYDFTNYERSDRTYDGNAGKKLGIIIENEYWFLKFPKRTDGMRNMEISYTTSPLSEYIGSNIYKFLDIPVHETRLGIFDDKAVVACKDFETSGCKLHKFKQFQNMFTEEVEKYENNPKNRNSQENAVLEKVLLTINTNPILLKIDGIVDRFWDMFVVDALIGNNDRNNGNWGLLYHDNGYKELAPVYDNGASFKNKSSDLQLRKTLSNLEGMRDSAYNITFSTFRDENNKSINPFTFLNTTRDKHCKMALSRITQKIDLREINSFVNSIPDSFHGVRISSKEQREYITKVIQMRYEDKFLEIKNKALSTPVTMEEPFSEEEYEAIRRLDNINNEMTKKPNADQKI